MALSGLRRDESSSLIDEMTNPCASSHLPTIAEKLYRLKSSVESAVRDGTANLSLGAETIAPLSNLHIS